MTMDSNVVTFPLSVSRKAHARKPRALNGTPEERAAQVAAQSTTAATVIELRRPVPRAAALPPCSAQELVEAMATLDENSRQYVLGYMQGLIDARKTRGAS